MPEVEIVFAEGVNDVIWFKNIIQSDTQVANCVEAGHVGGIAFNASKGIIIVEHSLSDRNMGEAKCNTYELLDNLFNSHNANADLIVFIQCFEPIRDADTLLSVNVQPV